MATKSEGNPMKPQTQVLDPSLLDRAVKGRNLCGTTLRENLQAATLLVFLRHLG